MNSDLLNLRARFGDMNYLHGARQWSIKVTDKKGNKVSLYYDATKPGFVEVLDPPRWMRIMVDSFGIGYIEIDDLHRYFDDDNGYSW